MQSVIEDSAKKGQASPSPSPASPCTSETPTSVPLAADGKRPMYPPTSHLSAPAQPKRRSTMNSRESAAFDESLMMANANAFKESRMMASSVGSGSSENKRKRKKKEDSEDQGREDSLNMDVVKEEDEDAHEDHDPSREEIEADQNAQSEAFPSGKRRKLDTASIADPDPLTATESGQQEDDTIVEHTGVDEAQVEAMDDSQLLEEEQTLEGEEDAQDDAPTGGPKKRRRRRGPGATAPIRKKTPAKPRSSRPRTALEIATNLTEGEDTEGIPETPATATAASFADAEGEAPAMPSVIASAANRSARKRKAMGDDDIPTVVLQAAGGTGRAVSPAASIRTADSSHSSSDKPLAQHSAQSSTPAGTLDAASSFSLQRAESNQSNAFESNKDASGRVSLMPPSAIAKGKRPAKVNLTADEIEEAYDSERGAVRPSRGQSLTNL